VVLVRVPVLERRLHRQHEAQRVLRRRRPCLGGRALPPASYWPEPRSDKQVRTHRSYRKGLLGTERSCIPTGHWRTTSRSCPTMLARIQIQADRSKSAAAEVDGLSLHSAGWYGRICVPVDL
jgi:hypothetical protein